MSNFYTSINGISMMEGNHFNWKVIDKGPLYLHISVGGLNDMTGFNYNVAGNQLSIWSYGYDSNDVFIFKCDLDLAELIVLAHMDAENIEMPPLYKK